jgi:ABC-2 type transport system permease protein
VNIIGVIIRREFNTRVRSRGYLAATVLGVLAIIVLFIAPSIFRAVSGGQQIKLAVLDETGRFYSRLTADLTEKLDNGKPVFLLTQATGAEADRIADVKDGRLPAVLVIKSAPASGSGSSSAGAGVQNYEATLVTKDSPGATDVARLASELTAVATHLRLQGLGIPSDQVTQVFQPVTLVSQLVGTGPNSGAQASTNWALTYVLLLILYMTTLLYGVYVAMGVIEEKST